ncbi:MAG: hypothetical protein NVS4B10_09100 [Myxococcales bacterium]
MNTRMGSSDLRELRAPPEALARWAMQTPLPAQEATNAALAFLAAFEHASAALLPVPAVVLGEKAVLDSDGFLRQPRGALEHFRRRSERALAWLDQLIFFRERFPAAVERAHPRGLFQLARVFGSQDDELEAAVDLLVRECVMPEIEEVFLRAVTYPPLQFLLGAIRETETQHSADARRFASAVLGPLSGKRVWVVRKRLVAAVARAILGARPLLEALERGGLQVERGRAARGFARRLEEAVGELDGTRVLPAALIARLAGDVDWTGAAVEAAAAEDAAAEGAAADGAAADDAERKPRRKA